MKKRSNKCIRVKIQLIKVGNVKMFKKGKRKCKTCTKGKNVKGKKRGGGTCNKVKKWKVTQGTKGKHVNKGQKRNNGKHVETT